MFTNQDKLFIRRIAGNYPFLLQALAATLLEITNLGEERQIHAAHIFYQRVAFILISYGMNGYQGENNIYYSKSN
jgi:hypothetical protein